MRLDPSPLRNLGVARIVDHYDRIIRGLDSKPTVVGHSFGGAFTQVLLDPTTVLSEQQFRYAFGNALTAEASRAASERSPVPAANRVLFERATVNLAPHSPLKVDFEGRS